MLMQALLVAVAIALHRISVTNYAAVLSAILSDHCPQGRADGLAAMKNLHNHLILNKYHWNKLLGM